MSANNIPAAQWFGEVDSFWTVVKWIGGRPRSLVGRPGGEAAERRSFTRVMDRKVGKGQIIRTQVQLFLETFCFRTFRPLSPILGWAIVHLSAPLLNLDGSVAPTTLTMNRSQPADWIPYLLSGNSQRVTL
jgi:hypothetical protein